MKKFKLSWRPTVACYNDHQREVEEGNCGIHVLLHMIVYPP